jgi:hypothetical protein
LTFFLFNLAQMRPQSGPLFPWTRALLQSKN